MNKRSLGSSKEELACTFLTEKGYTVVCRNYYTKAGELDIVARDRQTYVFIEVKYRSSTGYGNPLEAVTFAKQRRIRRAAQFYLLQNHISPNVYCRFDVIGILGEEITHIENAF